MHIHWLCLAVSGIRLQAETKEPKNVHIRPEAAQSPGFVSCININVLNI